VGVVDKNVLSFVWFFDGDGWVFGLSITLNIVE